MCLDTCEYVRVCVCMCVNVCICVLSVVPGFYAVILLKKLKTVLACVCVCVCVFECVGVLQLVLRVITELHQGIRLR